MSKRAEIAALKVYPKSDFNGVETRRKGQRKCFIQGYEQAEEDLTLTPEDIGLINKILFDLHFEGFDPCSTEAAQKRNAEALRRFNEQRKK